MKLNQIIDEIIDKSYRKHSQAINQKNQNVTTLGISSTLSSGASVSTDLTTHQLHQRLEGLTLQVNLLHEILQFMFTFGHNQLNDECIKQFVLKSSPPSVQHILYANPILLDKVVHELKTTNLSFI